VVWQLSSVVTNMKTVGLSYSPIVVANFEIHYIRAGNRSYEEGNGINVLCNIL